MTLIKDLIHIPERVQRGDFVLNLASGLEDEAIDRTLKDYVVTPQLARCFEDALSFVKSTVISQQNRNKGAYLHGSFGTGKSHFMAVLNLLVQGNAQARAIPELAPSVAKHSDWMQSRNILLVPYHMIGAASIEAGVLGGYARHVRKLHPEAPVPGFYMSGRLFEDAQAMRGHMGDERFFAVLNSAPGKDPWGDAAGGWDMASFEAVLSGQASDEDHKDLVRPLSLQPGPGAGAGGALLGAAARAHGAQGHADAAGRAARDPHPRARHPGRRPLRRHRLRGRALFRADAPALRQCPTAVRAQAGPGAGDGAPGELPGVAGLAGRRSQAAAFRQ